MKITRDEARSLADRLAEVLHVDEYDPHTMTTVEDLAAAMGVTNEVAETELERLVKNGLMEKTQARKEGRRRNVWREIVSGQQPQS